MILIIFFFFIKLKFFFNMIAIVDPLTGGLSWKKEESKKKEDN